MLAFFTHIILSYTYRDHKYILTAAFLARVHLTNAKGFLYLFTRILHIDTPRIQQEDIAVYLITHQGLSSKPGGVWGHAPPQNAISCVFCRTFSVNKDEGRYSN